MGDKLSGIDWLESLLETEQGGEVTAGDVTALTPGHVTAISPNVTPGRGTATRRYKPRKRRCKGCREAFTPKRNKSAIYCSDACRKRGNRAKMAQERKAHPTSTEGRETLCICLWCGLDFLADPTKRPKYHADSCKEKAYRQRRLSAVEAVATIRNYSPVKAEDVIEREGMKKISRWLQRQGYAYSDYFRRWTEQVEQGMSVDVEQG